MLQLGLEMIDSVGSLLEGNVGEVHKEVGVLNDVHVAQMLLEPAGNGAGLSGHLCIEEVVAAFQSTLEEAAAIVADTTGQIVGRDVRRSTSGRSQTDGEAAGQVQQNLRHEVAGVTQRLQTLFLRLANQRVVGLFQQFFKCDQVFQVSHVQAPLKVFAFK